MQPDSPDSLSPSFFASSLLATCTARCSLSHGLFNASTPPCYMQGVVGRLFACRDLTSRGCFPSKVRLKTGSPVCVCIYIYIGMCVYIYLYIYIYARYRPKDLP